MVATLLAAGCSSGGGDEEAATDGTAASGEVTSAGDSAPGTTAASKGTFPPRSTTTAPAPSTTVAPPTTRPPRTTTTRPPRTTTTRPPRTTTTRAPTTTTTRPAPTTTLPPRFDGFCNRLAGGALANLASLADLSIGSVEAILSEAAAARSEAPDVAKGWLDAAVVPVSWLRDEIAAGRVTDEASFQAWAITVAGRPEIGAAQAAINNIILYRATRC